MHLLSDFALKSPLLYIMYTYSIEKFNLFFQTETLTANEIFCYNLLEVFGVFQPFLAISIHAYLVWCHWWRNHSQVNEVWIQYKSFREVLCSLELFE